MERVRKNVLVFVMGFASCALAQRFLAPMPVGAASPERYVFTSPADVVSQVGGAVVNLDTYPEAAPREARSWSRFFPFPASADADPNAVASGVVISSDGYIVTNDHVVEDAGRIRARLADGRDFPARVIGRDPHTDLAVVKITAPRLTVAPFADSRRVRAGDQVVAIGNPLGFENSVTLGIVSAVRTGPFRINGHVLGDMIQTDAAINQGNSGGGLFGADGRLIGINTAIMAPSGGSGSIGIGFAIPAHQVRRVSETLIAKGQVRRPWLGIRYRPGAANSLVHQVRRGLGVLIEEVLPDSPAAAAGLQPADILRELGDLRIHSADDLHTFMGRYEPGQQVRARVLREGKEQTLTLTLAERPGR